MIHKSGVILRGGSLTSGMLRERKLIKCGTLSEDDTTDPLPMAWNCVSVSEETKGLRNKGCVPEAAAGTGVAQFCGTVQAACVGAGGGLAGLRTAWMPESWPQGPGQRCKMASFISSATPIIHLMASQSFHSHGSALLCQPFLLCCSRQGFL